MAIFQIVFERYYFVIGVYRLRMMKMIKFYMQHSIDLSGIGQVRLYIEAVGNLFIESGGFLSQG